MLSSAAFSGWETEIELVCEAINDVTTTHHSKVSVMWWSVCGLVNMGVEEV